ncbi:MAG TPA: hypothetical protein QGF05_14535 [Dehalococcoidia bacterium]|nr:hypothetical protein [Dehalococcoidia bacterium]
MVPETTVSYAFQDSGQTLILEVRDGVNADDFIEVLNAAKRDAQYRSDTTIIVDASQATESAIDGDAVRRLARFSRADDTRLGQRVGLVPRPVPASYGLSRMYQMLSDSQRQIEIFETLDEALEWARSPSSLEALPSPGELRA